MIWLGILLIVIGVGLEWNATRQMRPTRYPLARQIAIYTQVFAGWFVGCTGLLLILFGVAGHTLQVLVPSWLFWG